MRIVADSGPILSFSRANHLDLLQEVMGQLLIPAAVYEEMVVRGAGKPGGREVQESSWISCELIQDRALVEQLPSILHLGEREAIVLAKGCDAVLLVDEREARRAALRQSIVVVGSLYVLKEAKDRGIIPQVKLIRNGLIEAGTYIGAALCQRFLQQIDEA